MAQSVSPNVLVQPEPPLAELPLPLVTCEHLDDSASRQLTARWSLTFHRGTTDKLNDYLTLVSQAAGPETEIRLVLHELNGRDHLQKTQEAFRKAGGKVVATGFCKNADYEFAGTSVFDPPYLIAGEPFDFDWVADYRHESGTFVKHNLSIRLTIHVFLQPGLVLEDIVPPENVEVRAGGAVGNFIVRVENHRKYGTPLQPEREKKPAPEKQADPQP